MTNNAEEGLEGVDKLVSIVSQMIMQSAKSKKQVEWNKNIDGMRNIRETPLNLGLGK